MPPEPAIGGKNGTPELPLLEVEAPDDEPAPPEPPADPPEDPPPPSPAVDEVLP